MKSLIVFFLMAFTVSAAAQHNIVNVVQSKPLDSSDVQILKMLESKDGELKAVVLIEVNGEILEQKFIVRTRPCRCDPQDVRNYLFYTDDRKVIINIADTSASLIVESYDRNIPDELAMSVSLSSRKSQSRK